MDLKDNSSTPAQNAAPTVTPPEVPAAENSANIPGMPYAPAPSAMPEPPWVQYRAARQTAASDNGSYAYRAPEGPAYGGVRRKSHRGRNIFLICLAFLAALCLGGALMFYAIYSGALVRWESVLQDYLPGASAGMRPEDEMPEDVPDREPDTGSPELPPMEETPDPVPQHVPGELPREPFRPVVGAPTLEIVRVETEGAHARREMGVPDIAELVSPSVVGVIKYPTEDPQAGYTIGSGIIFTEDGYIITNEHVVADAYSLKILLNDGTEYDGALVTSDSDADIAIVKIEAEDLTPAEFGDSSQLRVGELSVAIGCPASVDLQGTTTSGIISALDRVITLDAKGRAMRLLQTDAAINPGNSGGPLLNRFGQVIGINTVKLNSATYEGLCFAIPSSELEHIVSDLFTYGYVRGYPAIGITARTVFEEETEEGVTPSGVLVATVNSGSGAFGKVEPGDIITHCNGKEVITVAQINTIKNRLQVGDGITLTIWRGGETFDVEITLVDQYDLADE